MTDESCAPEGLHPDFAALFREILDPAAAAATISRAQTPIMTMVEARKLHALQVAYEKALENPQAKIPTLLHAAIEALK